MNFWTQTLCSDFLSWHFIYLHNRIPQSSNNIYRWFFYGNTVLTVSLEVAETILAPKLSQPFPTWGVLQTLLRLSESYFFFSSISYVTMALNATTFHCLNILGTSFNSIVCITWLEPNWRCIKMCVSLCTSCVTAWAGRAGGVTPTCPGTMVKGSSWEWLGGTMGGSRAGPWLQDWPLGQVLSSPICLKGQWQRGTLSRVKLLLRVFGNFTNLSQSWFPPLSRKAKSILKI